MTVHTCNSDKGVWSYFTVKVQFDLYFFSFILGVPIIPFSVPITNAPVLAEKREKVHINIQTVKVTGKNGIPVNPQQIKTGSSNIPVKRYIRRRKRHTGSIQPV